MNLENLTIEKISTLLSEKKISCSELTLFYLENIEKHKDKNAVLEVFVPIFNNDLLNEFVQSRFDFIFIFKNTIIDVLSRITYYNNI